MRIKINKIQIYSVGFFVVALLLIIFLVSPTLRDIKYNSDKILSNKSELVFTDKQSKEIEKFQNNYEVYEPNLVKIDQILIDPKNPISFVEYLESSGRESGVALNINLINSEKKETLNNLPAIILNLNVKGGFVNVLNFSERIEKGPYLVKIKKLTMNREVLESERINVDAEFLIYVATK